MHRDDLHITIAPTSTVRSRSVDSRQGPSPGISPPRSDDEDYDNDYAFEDAEEQANIFLQKIMLTVIFPMLLALIAFINVDIFSLTHLVSFIFHFTFPVRVACDGASLHVPRQFVISANLVVAVGALILSLGWNMFLFFNENSKSIPEVAWLTDLGLSNHCKSPLTLLLKTLIPYLTLIGVCLKCNRILPNFHCMKDNGYPILPHRFHDESNVIRTVCVILFILVGLSRPSVLGFTFMAFGILHNFLWLCRPELSYMMFGMVAELAVFYVGLLIVLEYVARSSSLYFPKIQDHWNVGEFQPAPLIGLYSNSEFRYFIHESLMLLLFLLLYHYINNCDLDGDDTTIDEYSVSDHTQQGHETFSEGSNDDRCSETLIDGLPALIIPPSRHIAFMTDIVNLCHQHSHTILLGLFFMLVLAHPSIFSIYWLILGCIGLYLSPKAFLVLLPSALPISWLSTIWLYLGSMAVKWPDTAIYNLLGMHPNGDPESTLVLSCLVPLFITLCVKRGELQESQENQCPDGSGEETPATYMNPTECPPNLSLGSMPSLGDVTPSATRTNSPTPVPGEYLPPAVKNALERLVATTKTFVGAIVERHLFKWLTLLAVFWTGLLQVSIANALFIVFFCIFFIWPHLARRSWLVLIIYTQLCIVMMYTCMTLLKAKLLPRTRFLEILGAIQVKSLGQPQGEYDGNTWYLPMYIVVMFLAFVEWNVILTEKHGGTYNLFFFPGVWVQFFTTRAFSLMYFLYIAFLPFNASGVTIISFGYLLIFLACMVLTLEEATNFKVRIGWYVAASYGGAVVLLSYLYQFDDVNTWMNILFDNHGLSSAAVGLKKFDHSIQTGLLPWTFVVVLAVYNLTLMRNICRHHKAKLAGSMPANVSMVEANNYGVAGVSAYPTAPTGDGREMSAKQAETVGSGDSEDSPTIPNDSLNERAALLGSSPANPHSPAGPPPGGEMSDTTSYVVEIVQRIFILLSPVFIVLVLFYAAMVSYTKYNCTDVPTKIPACNIKLPDQEHGWCIQHANCITCIYVCMALIWNLRPGVKFSKMLSYLSMLYSALVLIFIYLYQFDLFQEGIARLGLPDSTVAYIGLTTPLQRMVRGTTLPVTDHFSSLLWPHLFVFMSVVLHRTTEYWKIHLKIIGKDVHHPLDLFFPPASVSRGDYMPIHGSSSPVGLSHPMGRRPKLAKPEETRDEPLWISLGRWLFDSCPQTWGFHAVLLGLSVYTNTTCLQNKIWGLIALIFTGLLALVGRLATMSKRVWTSVVVGMSFSLIFLYLLSLGLPGQQQVDLVERWCKSPLLEGEFFQFLMLQPTKQEIWDMVMIVVMVGCYRTCVIHMVKKGGVKHRGGLTNLLMQKATKSRLHEVRKRLDAAGQAELKRLLPAPQGKKNFMEPPRPFISKMKFIWFMVLPYVVLFLIFCDGLQLYSESNIGRRPKLSILNFFEILIVLAMFHSTESLPWEANLRWKYVPFFYYMVVLTQVLFTIPQPKIINEGSAGFSLFFFQLLSRIKEYGWGELDNLNPALQYSILVLSYIQYLNFDDMSYVYVLHYNHKHAVAAQGRSVLNVELRRKLIQSMKIQGQQQKEARTARLNELRGWRETREKDYVKGSFAADEMQFKVFRGTVSDDGLGEARPCSVEQLPDYPESPMDSPTMVPANSSISSSPHFLRSQNLKLLEAECGKPQGQSPRLTLPGVSMAPRTPEPSAAPSSSKPTFEALNARAEGQVKIQESGFRESVSRFRSQPGAGNRQSRDRILFQEAGAEWTWVSADKLEETMKEFFMDTQNKVTTIVDAITVWLLKHSLAAELGLIDIRNIYSEDRFENVIYASVQFLLSYTDWLFYGLCVFYLVYQPSLWILLLNITVFFYALLVTPHRVYWELLLLYVEAIICLKALVMVVRSHSQKSNATLMTFFLTLCGSEDHGFTQATPGDLLDLLLLVLIVLHKTMLKWGMWYVSDDAEASMEWASKIRFGRVFGFGPASDGDGTSTHKSSFHSRLNHSFMSHPALSRGHLGRRRCKQQYTISNYLWDRCRQFTNWVQRRVSMEDKIGKDFYMLEFFFDFLFFTTFLFSYYSIAGRDDDIFGSIQANMIPGDLVLWQGGLFLLMVINRIIYLFRSLKSKVVLHYAVALAYIFSFLYVMYGDKKMVLYKSKAVRLLLVLKALQLACTAQQIKFGYPRVIRNRLMDDYKPLKYYLYQGVRSLPLVFELRNILDWTVTSTTLKLWYWLKLEDIHHELTVARADRLDTAYYNRKIGEPFPKTPKCYLGFGLFLIIMAVLFMPLFLHSSFSPALAFNAVNVTEVDLAFGLASPPLYESQVVIPSSDIAMDNINNASLAEAIEAMRPALESSYSKQYRIQVIEMSEYSHNTWGISPPAKKVLLKWLSTKNAEVTLNMTIHMTRVQPGYGETENYVYQTYTIPQKRKEELFKILSSFNHTTPQTLIMDNFYTPFLFNRLSLSTYQSPNGTDDSRLKQNCRLTFHSDPDYGPWLYTTLECNTLFMHGNGIGDEMIWNTRERECVESKDDCPDYERSEANKNHDWSPLYFVIASTKSPSFQRSEFLKGFGIMTLYTTVVLTVSRLFRYMITGTAYRVYLQDMEFPYRLIQLVEDIKLARAEVDLALEEQLYYELLRIYQSTELLKYWTRPPAPTITDV